MFDIYEALKAGKSTDDIANAFVNELNDAAKRIQAEQEAEAAAKRAAEEKDNNAAAVADHINSFLKMYYPEKPLSFTAKDVIAICEASVLADDLNKKISEAPNFDAALDEFSAALENFFQKNGI